MHALKHLEKTISSARQIGRGAREIGEGTKLFEESKVRARGTERRSPKFEGVIEGLSEKGTGTSVHNPSIGEACKARKRLAGR